MKSTDLLNRLPEQTFETVEVDASRFWDKPEGCVVFTFRDPGLAECTLAQLEAPKFRKFNYDWPLELCSSMALCALAFVRLTYREQPDAAPESIDVDNPGEYIATIANRSRDAFSFIGSGFRMAFPYLDNLKDVVDAEKKDSGDPATANSTSSV